MSFAPAVQKLKNEGAYAVLAAATALEQQGRDIVHFEIGQPDYPTPEHVVKAGIEAIQSGKTTYVNPSGTGDLKGAIAKHVAETRGVAVSASQVVVGPGCKPGIFFAMMALVEPGDEVICPNPGFPSYNNTIDVVGAKLVAVPLNKDCSSYDMAALTAAITPKTKVLILNSPSNPTGGVIPPEDLDAIAELAKANPQLWVFSDEIYAQLVYDGRKVAASYLKSAEKLGVLDRALMFDGASKTYCMTGWRLGWAVVPEKLAERLHLLMVHAIGCSANFTQVAGVAAIGGPQDAVDAMVSEYEKRRDYVVQRFNAMPGITCPSPAGAFYAFPDVTGLGKPCQELASILLNEAGVAVLPGTDFGDGGVGHIRISYVRGMEVLKEGLDRIEACVQKMAAGGDTAAPASIPFELNDAYKTFDDDASFGKPAPALDTLKYVKGDPVTLGGGKITVVLFFAKFAKGDYTTVQGVSEMAALFPQVQFLGISCDPAEDDAKSFLKKIGTSMPEIYIDNLQVPYPLAWDDRKVVKCKFMQLAGLASLGASATFVVDGAGTIVWREQFGQGYFPPKKGQLCEQVRRLVAGEELLKTNGATPVVEDDDDDEMEMGGEDDYDDDLGF